jgi:hypothetical protein
VSSSQTLPALLGLITTFPCATSKPLYCNGRVPTALFKKIVTDMDLMFMQYGLPMEHQTEEASSRFIAPVSLFHCHERRAIDKHIRCRSSITWSDCLILQSRIRRSVLHGRITTKGRIEYQFKTFSGVTIILVEVKLGTGTHEEYLNAIANHC